VHSLQKVALVEWPIGSKVRMVKCREAEYYGDTTWKTRSEPWMLCGEQVVLLEGKSGGFATRCLEVVKSQTDCPDCGAAGQVMGSKGLFVNLICRACWKEWKVLSDYCPACKKPNGSLAPGLCEVCALRQGGK